MTTMTRSPPQAQDAALLEPSFLDLAAAIEAAKDLPEQTRRHWACSVRQIIGPPRSFRLAGRRYAI